MKIKSVRFRWKNSSVLVDDMNLGLERFKFWFFQIWVWPISGQTGSKFQAFWRSSKGFEVQFWWMILGSSEFGVQRSLYLGSIQHYLLSTSNLARNLYSVMNMSEGCVFGPRLFSRFYERLDQRDKFINVHMYV